MAHDYTELDRAIINRVAKGCVGFSALCGAVLKHSKSLAANDKAPAWRIVDRRLQALRKAGRICYQRKPEGWVLHEAAANAKLMAAAPVLLDYYRASRNLQMTLGHPDATAQDEHEAEAAYAAASSAAADAVGALGAA